MKKAIQSENYFEKVATAELVPYAKNSRTHSPEQIKQIAASIQEFGFTNPILIDEKKNIIAGHGRLMAAQEMQLAEVPCVVITGLTPAQKKALVIADNKIALNSGWNDEILKSELSCLKEMDFDLLLTGFSTDEIDNLLANVLGEGLTDEDTVPEVPENPKTVLGDVWLLGEHRLMCGDSTILTDVEKLMGGGMADMVFTDPPYNIDYDFSQNGMVQSGQRKAKFDKIKNDAMSNDDFDKFILSVFSNLMTFMKDGASYYISAGRESTQTFNRILKDLDFHIQSWLIWVKENFNISRLDYHPKHEVITYGWKKGKSHNWFGNRSQTDVWMFERDKNAVHPTQKPTGLIEYSLENSCKKRGVVLDLFGGSGSTLIACEKTGRVNRSMELDPKYCDVIIKRWQGFTGKKAIHAETQQNFEDL